MQVCLTATESGVMLFAMETFTPVPSQNICFKHEKFRSLERQSGREVPFELGDARASCCLQGSPEVRFVEKGEEETRKSYQVRNSIMRICVVCSRPQS